MAGQSSPEGVAAPFSPNTSNTTQLAATKPNSSQNAKKCAPKGPPLFLEYFMIAAVVLSMCETFRQALNHDPVASGQRYPDFLAIYLPFFVPLMVFEWLGMTLAGWSNAGARYRWGDLWGSVTAGMTSALVSIAVRRIVGDGLNEGIWLKYGWNQQGAHSWYMHVLCLLVCDFGYYWFHRFAHQVQWLWAAHRNHHSSDHFNFSTALRQGSWQGLPTWAFYLPLAVFFPPDLWFMHNSFNTIVQFWIHTCAIRRLGFVEWFLMTPSHHRIHHDRRVHKNFGGLLIVWDRLFGSFLDEREQEVVRWERMAQHGEVDDGEEMCYFGVSAPDQHYKEVVIQTQGWLDIVKKMGRGVGAMKAAWVGPGWTTVTAARDIAGTGQQSKVKRNRQETDLCLAGCWYTALQFSVVLFYHVVIAGHVAKGTSASVWWFGLLTVPSCFLQAAMLDTESWARPLEMIRTAVVSVVCAVGVTQGLCGEYEQVVRITGVLHALSFCLCIGVAKIFQPAAGAAKDD